MSVEVVSRGYARRFSSLCLNLDAQENENAESESAILLCNLDIYSPLQELGIDFWEQEIWPSKLAAASGLHVVQFSFFSPWV